MKTPPRALPRGIWVLGFVSLLMDMSSELVHSLLPLLLVTTFGASMVTIGVLEGVAEAMAAFTRAFSGALSDRFRRRKPLILLGYGLGALTKPVFALAPSIGWVFAARSTDRIGKGIRGAPRDALVADLTPPSLRGAAYGLRQALDTVGAVLGPLLAVAFMLWLAGDITAVLWIAIVPAFLAVLLLGAGVREAAPAAGAEAGAGWRMVLAGAERLPRAFWMVVLLGGVFTLARFSEAFLILRAQDIGVALAWVPAILVVMNVAYATVAYPAGAAADRLPARTLLLIGLAVLVVADLTLALAAGPMLVFVGAALWGIHMAFTQGLLAKLVADTAPPALRGTAFGVFHLVGGLALLLASLIAGALWHWLGAPATFLAGAVFATLAAGGLLLYRPGPTPSEPSVT